MRSGPDLAQLVVPRSILTDALMLQVSDKSCVNAPSKCRKPLATTPSSTIFTAVLRRHYEFEQLGVNTFSALP